MDWLVGRIIHDVATRETLDKWLVGPLPDSLVDFPELQKLSVLERERAARLLELRFLYNQLGSQPAEMRMTVEPFNPLPEESTVRFINQALSGIGVTKSASDFGLSVLSRSFVDACYPADLSSFFNLPPGQDQFLFDPMMGFLLWKEGSRQRNAWFGNVRDLVGTQLENPAIQKLLIRNQDDHFNLGVSLLEHLIPHLRRVPRFTYDSAKIPVVEVETQEDLEDLANDLRNACERCPLPMHAVYRGQPSEYQLPDRSKIVRKGLCTYSNYRDHSLIPSLYRSYDKYLRALPEFQKFLSRMLDWNLFSETIFGDPATYHTLDGEPYTPLPLPDKGFVEAAIGVTGKNEANRLFADLGWFSIYTVKDVDGNVVEKYKKRYRHGQKSVRSNLILQHYGAPTPFIDVTYDIQIAEWFALNKIGIGADGLAISTQSSGQPHNPTLFVLLALDGLTPLAKTSELVSPSEALRPHRQACGLLGGAGNLFRNAPARFIALKIKFARTFVPKGLPTAPWLFPGPDEDSALEKLLRANAVAESDPSIFPVYWFR